MQTEVVASGEGSLTEVALERTVTRVFTVVTGEFIRSRELPAAALPVATVGFLARVGAQMGLEVRAFRVRLGAARVGAVVAGLAFPAPGAPAAFLGLRRGGGCCGCVHGVVWQTVQEVDQLLRGRRRRHHRRVALQDHLVHHVRGERHAASVTGELLLQVYVLLVLWLHDYSVVMLILERVYQSFWGRPWRESIWQVEWHVRGRRVLWLRGAVRGGRESLCRNTGRLSIELR